MINIFFDFFQNSEESLANSCAWLGNKAVKDVESYIVTGNNNLFAVLKYATCSIPECCSKNKIGNWFVNNPINTKT